jgi:hypothetical protein
MVTYSCDRCGVVVDGPGLLFGGSFVTQDGAQSRQIAGKYCSVCVSKAQALLEAPEPDSTVGDTVLVKSINQAASTTGTGT